MKRLLAEGMGDIYQLSHVFRDGEWSHKHNPEFTMAEWYRLGFTLEQIIEETVQFIRFFWDICPIGWSAIARFFSRKPESIMSQADEKNSSAIFKKPNPFYPDSGRGKRCLLNLILGSKVEPKLGWNGFSSSPTILLSSSFGPQADAWRRTSGRTVRNLFSRSGARQRLS